MENKKIIVAIVIAVVLISSAGLVFASDFFDSKPDNAHVAESELMEEDTTTLEVPAPGNEDVDEMVVATDSADQEEETEEDTDVLSSISYSIETDNFSFVPDVIEASPGQEVTVKIVNVAGVHDFIIDELDVHTEHVNKAGDELEVTFTIPEDASGEYEFYCSIGNHRELGMVGTLAVSP